VDSIDQCNVKVVYNLKTSEFTTDDLKSINNYGKVIPNHAARGFVNLWKGLLVNGLLVTSQFDNK